MTRPNVPVAFWQRMAQQLDHPEELARFREALAQPAVTSLRMHPHKAGSTFAEAEPIAWHPQGRRLAQRPSFLVDPHFHAGAYYVQEASSMLLYQAIDWQTPCDILDLCAAPGGKSTLIAAAMARGSRLVCNEMVPQRAKVLQEAMTRWGNPAVTVTRSPAAAFADAGAQFDVIVVDAPCSGEGMFRKDAEAVAQWSPELVVQCAHRQREILQDIVPCLRPGGQLVYATCTYAPAEDEAMIQGLLKTTDLQLAPLPDLARYGASPLLALPDATQPPAYAAYRCYPHRIAGEGFFIAKLQRPAHAQAGHAFTHAEPQQLSKQARAFAQRHLPEAWLTSYQLLEKDGVLSIAAPLPLARKAKRSKGKGDKGTTTMRILQQGIPIGRSYGRRSIQGYKPLHGLAMLPIWQGRLETGLELNLSQALRFLSGLELDIPSSAQGWLLAYYQGSVLGWLKAGGGRVNSYYPLAWRIRKPLAELEQLIPSEAMHDTR